ncbi:MAG: hypothetical protein F4Z40_03255 [Chloroflexi bacterium]|nr:hypothetical protein [Chloroflexota bacterium]MXX66032.1 hypothetical protein [Chloroflexota bacterium]MXY12514.1 hypothetical protein [Chloroflexota bacterium]MYB17165.1 hypothetical protein [Chloroflexota bacterium]MYC46731.1 hypothetical protein [Chloroflexota bacterium]
MKQKPPARPPRSARIPDALPGRSGAPQPDRTCRPPKARAGRRLRSPVGRRPGRARDRPAAAWPVCWHRARAGPGSVPGSGIRAIRSIRADRRRRSSAAPETPPLRRPARPPVEDRRTTLDPSW